MDFDFSDVQRMLRDAGERFVAKEYELGKRRALLATPLGYSDDHWRTFADLGWLGLTLPEHLGGFGGSAVDSLVLMEAFGKGLVLEPYAASAVLGAALLPHAQDPLRARLCAEMIEGRHKLALAYAEPGGRFDPAEVATRVVVAGRDFVLTGDKTAVLHGGCADSLIVSTRSAGTDRDQAGIDLFLVPRGAAGVTIREYGTIDGLRAAEVALREVRVPPEALVGAAGAGLPLLEQALDRGIAAVCAEAVGCMARLLEMTLDYLKTRQQFGVVIGQFQALQHRAVDMFVALEQARSMAYMAAVKVDLEDAQERRRHLSAAKRFIALAGKSIGQEAVQLHGGIGVTDELAVSHYFKRLTAINTWFGDAAYHLERFIESQDS